METMLVGAGVGVGVGVGALVGGGGLGCDQDLWTEICPKQIEWLHHRRASNTSAVRRTWD